MMQRIPEPELMDTLEQAEAYANADFEQAHNAIVQNFSIVFPQLQVIDNLLDLGCGAADIAIRFAKLFPQCKIDAVDGAKAMLQQAEYFVAQASLEQQITLHCQNLPNCKLPDEKYAAIVSNSLLHHLHEPQHLWSTVQQYADANTAIFICDLLRPESKQHAQNMLEQYAKHEPEVLQHDFYHSLLAAFTLDEVEQQLQEAGINGLQLDQISDRHLLIYGYIE